MDAEFNAAMRIALSKLRTSERFESEIRAALSDYDSQIVDRVVKTLRDQQFLSDKRATHEVVRKHSGKRAKGMDSIRAELTAKGADDASIDQAISELPSETERAWNLLTGKFTSSDDPRRAYRFLAARGFDSDTAESVVLRMFGDIGVEEN